MTSIAALLGDIAPYLICPNDAAGASRQKQPYFGKGGAFCFEGCRPARVSLPQLLGQDPVSARTPPHRQPDDVLKGLLKSTLVYNPRRRPTVAKLLQELGEGSAARPDRAKRPAADPTDPSATPVRKKSRRTAP